ncbi:hypothetical protein J6590_018663 [Homalodisca vitripennis]|nr:hypothetical protein J6590_018663 [Homalodisca vitripennis]
MFVTRFSSRLSLFRHRESGIPATKTSIHVAQPSGSVPLHVVTSDLLVPLYRFPQRVRGPAVIRLCDYKSPPFGPGVAVATRPPRHADGADVSQDAVAERERVLATSPSLSAVCWARSCRK